MEILGLSPYLAAIFIAIVGITATNVVAWLKKLDGFSIRSAVASSIIGLPTALIVVATELKVLASVELPELEATIIVSGLIAQVAGFDILIKNGFKAAGKALNKEDIEE